MQWPWKKRAPLALPEAPAAPVQAPAPVAKAAPTKPSGSDGVAIFGGFLQEKERDPNLVGIKKWITFDNITLNTAIVASAMRIWTDLGGSAKLRAEPNPRGGKDAQKAADLVTEGLLEAQMSMPLRTVVRRQIMKRFRGFAMHEAIIRRRADGKIVIGDLQHRPQWTVYRWIKADEQSPWTAIEQLTQTGAGPFTIPRERLLYSVDNTLTDSPAGTGLLRHLAEMARVRDVYTRLEGIGYQTDLGGMPVGRAPLGEMRQMAMDAGIDTNDAAKLQAFVTSQLKPLTDLLSAHNKRADQWLMLDSVPYHSKDAPQTPSNVLKWSFDVVRTAMTAAPGIAAAIARLDIEMARLMNAEWMLVGGGDSAGTYGMHANKTEMLGHAINSVLDDICDDMRRDLAARLVALNGMDPELCTPSIEHEPIVTLDVETACRAVMLLQTAGLAPQDKARNVLRARMDLPAEPDIDEQYIMLPRGSVMVPESNPTQQGAGAGPTTAKPGATPAGDPGKPGNVNADPKANGGKTP